MDWRQVRALYFCAVAHVDGNVGRADERMQVEPAARPFLEHLIAARGAAYGVDALPATDGRKLAELLGVEGERFRAALLRGGADTARAAEAIDAARHPYTRWLVRRAAERPSESLRADMARRQHERDPPQLEPILVAMAGMAGGDAVLAGRPRGSVAVQAFHTMLAATLGGRAAVAAMLRRVASRTP